MSKASKMQSILFIQTFIIIVLFALPLQAVVKQKHQELLTKTNSTHLALSWGDIWNILRRKKVPGGGRGGEICAIAPRKLVDPDSSINKGTEEIWSVQPLFLWHVEKWNSTENRAISTGK